ncbi:OsmC family protein [Georgenia sp. EYE_87]|uniref:OsmC family protein n=1 Tax=Georgenia sp. EYE_87 TaxID=2853448 RepID=UPI002002AA4D|nr:OsmC family protein [Georgenia sp. EYE_87]MCK6210720.1 OsmC family protein [Georgenia sp. EYE_87]
MTTTSHDRTAMNGVDVPVLFATVDAVRDQQELAEFQFRARNEWVSGTHNRSTIQNFYGAGQEDATRTAGFVIDADHPAVLVGQDNGPTAVEYLLHAIAACLTHGIANIASARGIELRRVASTVEGDISLLGMLGIDTGVRNGYRQIRVHFEIEGDASAEQLEAVVRRSQDRSAVYDVLTNGTDVVVDVDAHEAA